MVVYEVKDPAAVVSATQPKLPRADLDTAGAVQQAQAIGNLLGRKRGPWGREKPASKRPVVELAPFALREVMRLVEEINAQLAAQGTKLYLVVAAGDKGIAIDLYDCSDCGVCRSVHDISIEIHDLPVLLARLMHKTGIMVDTLS